LPDDLKDVINDPEKQKRLIIYINPPYAEAATAKRKGNKTGVAVSKAREKYGHIIGNAINEVFAQFMAIIYDQFPSAALAQFSTLKIVQAPNFSEFRNFFKAKFMNGFVIRANSFDNVNGNFPIGFTIWDLANKIPIKEIECDVIENDGSVVATKKFATIDTAFINDWYKNFYDKKEKEIGILNTRGNDFQNQNYIYISSDNNFNHTSVITKNNLLYACLYFAVRHCIEATWLNDRDQFLYPNDGYKNDAEFQNDCLTFTLFHSQNRISSKDGTNHWIPFTPKDVDAKSNFKSAFMADFLQERRDAYLAPAATAVFDAGLALWRYYHAATKNDPATEVNASLYDIREYFKGRNDKGKMNSKAAADEQFNALNAALRLALKALAEKIQPKVYEYGFLRE
jgi:hypothetical protein